MESILTPSELDALLQPTERPQQASTRAIDLVSRDHQAFAMIPGLQVTASSAAQHLSQLCTRLLRTGCRLTADPLEVHYVRIEEETRPVKMRGFYRRRLPSCREREIENGIALESLHADIQAGQRRSLTVRIIQAMPEIPRLPSQDQPLIVEILSIEMNDPRNPRWKTASLTEN